MGRVLINELEVKVIKLGLDLSSEFAEMNREYRDVSERRDSLEAYNMYEPCIVSVSILTAPLVLKSSRVGLCLSSSKSQPQHVLAADSFSPTVSPGSQDFSSLSLGRSTSFPEIQVWILRQQPILQSGKSASVW